MPRTKKFQGELAKITHEVPLDLVTRVDACLAGKKKTRSEVIAWGFERWLEENEERSAKAKRKPALAS